MHGLQFFFARACVVNRKLRVLEQTRLAACVLVIEPVVFHMVTLPSEDDNSTLHLG